MDEIDEINELKEQRKALSRSIKDKWAPIVRGESIDRFDATNCACCQIWYDGLFGQCNGCPISEDTGEEKCIGTPLSVMPTNIPADNARKYNQYDMAELAYLCHLRRRIDHKLYDLKNT